MTIKNEFLLWFGCVVLFFAIAIAPILSFILLACWPVWIIIKAVWRFIRRGKT